MSSRIRSVTWNLSDRSRRIMGWRWCEEHDVKMLQKIMAEYEANRPKTIWGAFEALRAGAARK